MTKSCATKIYTFSYLSHFLDLPDASKLNPKSCPVGEFPLGKPTKIHLTASGKKISPCEIQSVRHRFEFQLRIISVGSGRFGRVWNCETGLPTVRGKGLGCEIRWDVLLGTFLNWTRDNPSARKIFFVSWRSGIGQTKWISEFTLQIREIVSHSKSAIYQLKVFKILKKVRNFLKLP